VAECLWYQPGLISRSIFPFIAVPKLEHDDDDGREDEDMEDPDIRINSKSYLSITTTPMCLPKMT
jgi:hypothetical protein